MLESSLDRLGYEILRENKKICSFSRGPLMKHFFLMMKHGGEGWKSCSHESNSWMYDEGSCKHASAMQLDAEDRVAIMHPFFKIYPCTKYEQGFNFN